MSPTVLISTMRTSAVHRPPNRDNARGSSALASNDTGNSNTATGFGALLNNTVGNNNTAVGFKALKKSLGTRTSASGTRQASPS